MWDYGKFIEALKSGDANYAAELDVVAYTSNALKVKV
jgi:hypothetical protein